MIGADEISQEMFSATEGNQNRSVVPKAPMIFFRILSRWPMVTKN